MNRYRANPARIHFPDRPIECSEDDLLKRKPFAEAIARRVCTVPPDHGFTIAVLGEWGSGKSSVLNMVAEGVKEKDGAAAILRFNPWLFGGAKDLVTLFFGELSTQLGQDKNEKLKSVAKAILGLGQGIASLSSVPGASAGASALEQLSSSWLSPSTLEERRKQLSKALREAGSRVVVIIDDIDRLEPSETRDLVRLVRLTSDLPHLIFLLAFDGKRVAQSLGAQGLGDTSDISAYRKAGQKYLDKIVQESYTLPQMRRSNLDNLLTEHLNTLANSQGHLQLDERQWGVVRSQIIEPLIGNLRDVKRYVNSTFVTLDVIGQEVNLVDLLGLEAVRVLRPLIFEDLREHAESLTAIPGDPVPQDGLSQSHKDELNSMLENAEGGDREVLASVFATLFPTTQGIIGGRWPGRNWIPIWRRQRNVACEEVFLIYLQASLEDDDIALVKIRELISALSSKEELEKFLDKFDDKQFIVFVEKLGDFEPEFPENAIATAIPVLVGWIAKLSSQSDTFFDLPPSARVKHIIHMIIRRVPNEIDRGESLRAILGECASLSEYFHIIDATRWGTRPLLHDDQERAFKTAFISRLKCKSSEELSKEWDLSFILMQSLGWADSTMRSRLVKALRKHLKDDQFVLTLLRTARGYTRRTAFDITGTVPGHRMSVVERLYWEELAEIFGSELKDAVIRLAASPVYHALSDEDQATIDLAKEYAQGRRADARNPFEPNEIGGSC